MGGNRFLALYCEFSTKKHSGSLTPTTRIYIPVVTKQKLFNILDQFLKCNFTK